MPKLQHMYIYIMIFTYFSKKFNEFVNMLFYC